MMMGLCGFFGAFIWWLAWAFITGGGAEKALATVVVPLVLVILGAALTTFLVIAREGNRSLD